MSPVAIEATAAQIDLSGRIARTTTVAASPSAGTETIIASLTLPGDLTITAGVLLRAFLAFTVGTSGVSAQVRIRRTDVNGTVVADTGAVTAGIAATKLVAETVLGFDASPSNTGQVYVLTLTVGSGAAASTVSQVEFDALAV